MSETERPFLPMSWELGGDFMSGMADSIRERRAREVPAPTEEGVVEDETTFEEEWPEDEEWEEEEWEEEDEWDDEEWEVSEKPTLFERVSGLLIGFIDFIADVATLATVPAALLLVATAYQTTFGILETALLLWSGTAVTLMIANAKTRLLQKLRLR
jgi:hypothetical protein